MNTLILKKQIKEAKENSDSKIEVDIDLLESLLFQNKLMDLKLGYCFDHLSNDSREKIFYEFKTEDYIQPTESLNGVLEIVLSGIKNNYEEESESETMIIRERGSLFYSIFKDYNNEGRGIPAAFLGNMLPTLRHVNMNMETGNHSSLITDAFFLKSMIIVELKDNSLEKYIEK